MGTPDGVKYVPFGGAQVPASCKREIITQNGQKLYCVWTDDKGGKITYPQQKDYKNGETVYIHRYPSENEYVSKASFDEVYNRYHSMSAEDIKQQYDEYEEDIWTQGSKDQKNREWCLTAPWGTAYGVERKRETTPKIEVSTEEGRIFDTQHTTLSNMRGAKVTGSKNEDVILLDSSSDCTVDVSNHNNNMFVSDNVTVKNGKGNKVVAGDRDTTTIQTHNYETNTTTTKKEYKGKGTHKQ